MITLATRFLICALLTGNALALPRDNRVPGGIALLALPDAAPDTVQVFLGEARVPVVRDDGARTAVVGIPLAQAPGEARLELRAPAYSDTLRFTVGIKDYPEQRITLSDTSKVSPSEEQLARYAREAAEQKAVYQSFSPGERWPVFRMPIKGRFSSPFGLKRFFNGEARDPHAGLDIAAPEGRLVRAPADGIVVQTGDYFFNGRTVMIDHGQGVISMLCHLSRVDVEIGQAIGRGEIIGRVGHTGRATGPHLHWGVSINNARIDPRLVVPDTP